MSPLLSAYKYLVYWLDEVNEHSLHSPFLFDLYKNVIKVKPQEIDEIEHLREKLLNSTKHITYKDPGARKEVRKRKISDIAKTSLSDKKYSSLYLRLIEYYKPSCVIELGTSLGINTLYLSSAGIPVVTFEGVPELCELSKENFDSLKRENIKIIQGDIDNTLPEFLNTIKQANFIFFDANHTYEATINYFNMCVQKANSDSIFIFDDIYWSKGMAKAWNEIKNHEHVRVTLDLYRCGIVLFNKSLTKQHLALKF